MKLNNPDTLVAISAYAGDVHQVENNLPFYKHHGCKVVVLSPEDAPITAVSDPNVICMTVGKRCWAGRAAIERQIKFMELLSHFPHGYFLFNDSDSLCISAQIPKYVYEQDTVWSNEVLDTNPGASMLPKIAMQPPYFFSKRALRAMLDIKDNLPTSYYGEVSPMEDGRLPIPTECPDHLMLQLAHGSGFGHASFHHGASFETASDIGMSTMSELVRNHGRVLLHSVKTAKVLHKLVADRREFLRTHPEFR
jgi:hypothetical protein